MEIVFKLDFRDDIIFLHEAKEALKDSGFKIIDEKVQRDKSTLSSLGALSATDLIVTLGSAGAFTAFYNVVCNLIRKNNKRKISFEYGDLKFIIEGHNLKQEKEIMEKIVSEYERISSEKHH